MSKVCSVCGVTYADTLSFCPADGTTLRGGEERSDLVGQVIADRYIVTELLGEGGMGQVYLARHVRLPQQSAIKVLRREMIEDPAAVARFNREAANASRIDHDRVARVYDFGESAEGFVYLAMEYVPGKTLKALLEPGPMDPSRAAAIVRQIAEGLDAAHRMDIVHRDLKPENVMVIRDADGGERVKIVDFGIAKAVGDGGGGRTQLTRTGFIMGTPDFMSPEQLLGGTLDARSDIYALALVAYQCLTTDLPFATNGTDFGMAARLVTPPRPLITVSPSIRWPEDVQAVLDQGLARDPQDRPATAGAFARALSAAIEAWQGNVWADTGAIPAAARQAPSYAPPSPTAPVAPRGGPPVESDSAPAATVQVASAATPVVRKSRMPLIAAGLVVAAVGVGGALMAFNRSAPPAQSATVPTTTAAPSAASPTGTPSNAPVQQAAAPRSQQVATSTGAPLAPPPVPAATPVSAANRSPDGAGARRTLDSLAASFDPATVTDSAASENALRRAVVAIPMLLPRLATREDSGWAYVRLAEAYLLLNDKPRGCEAVRRGRPIVRGTNAAARLSYFDGAVGCE